MPSYYVDTGCDNQIRVDNCSSQKEAIEKFTERWDVEECTDNPSYKGWSSVTFYVSSPFEVCSEGDCDEEAEEDGACYDHAEDED